MNSLLRFFSCVFVIFSPLTAHHSPLTPSSARAQVASPQIGFVYPAGGRQGTSFEVKLGGEYLDGATSVRISGEGVQAKVLGQTRPLTLKQIDALRNILQNLEKKEHKTDADRKNIEEIRKKLVPPAVQPTPALAEIVTLEVTIDAKAVPGPRQLRLQANTGMSNPIVFVVGQLPEVRQKKVLVDPEAGRPRAPDITVTLPAGAREGPDGHGQRPGACPIPGAGAGQRPDQNPGRRNRADTNRHPPCGLGAEDRAGPE
jgi:hypothetical protein